MNSASFDLSIIALVLILDISCLTQLLRELGCHANRWTDNTRLFGAPQSRNWNVRFYSTKKNWNASENVQKIEIKLKLNAFTAWVVYIVERRGIILNE